MSYTTFSPMLGREDARYDPDTDVTYALALRDSDAAPYVVAYIGECADSPVFILNARNRRTAEINARTGEINERVEAIDALMDDPAETDTDALLPERDALIQEREDLAGERKALPPVKAHASAIVARALQVFAE